MSEVTINNSPVHSQSMISYPYGVPDSSYSCGFHTGIDFIPYGSTSSNPMLYSVVEGEVVDIVTTTTGALGVQALILSSDNEYWRYCHMLEGSLQVQVGDLVTTASPIGQMGATGNVTGIHLHLERSTTYAWQCNTFLNPATYLGIPNEDNTIINYEETPPVPPVELTKSKFKWVLYSNKLRERRNVNARKRF